MNFLKAIAFFILLGSPAVALELQEETPEQRCDVGKCKADCIVDYGAASAENKNDPYHRDYGPIGTAMCNQSCDDQRTYCLKHAGTDVSVPDWAPSSMGKMMTLYCLKHKDMQGCEKQIYCSHTFDRVPAECLQ
jgi:hypothetical protein